MSEQPKPRKPLRAQDNIPHKAPWRPPDWGKPEILAIKAMVRGDCPSHLQQRLIAFIINDLCATYDLVYRPGGLEGDRDTAFAAGRAWVGQQLIHVMKFEVGHTEEQ